MNSPQFLFPTGLDQWRDWLVDDAPRLGLVLLAVALVKLLSRPVIGRVLRGAVNSTARLSGEDPTALNRRVRTLEGTLSWLITFIAAFIGLTIALDIFGLNVAPIVAGVGIVGIAIGLGAQTLIKDVLNGIFILVEDQFGIGDQITVAGVSGEVMEINPRRTVVRDADGSIHTIPNSTITIVTNRTPALRRVHVEIDVPFADVGRAAAIANQVAADVAGERLADTIRPATIGSYAIVNGGDARLHLIGEVRSEANWAIEGELRSRLKRRFEDEKVEAVFRSESGD